MDKDKLYTAIKTDDVKLFAENTKDKGDLSLCYGRFPLLTLCYMYKSLKIVAVYEKELLAITDYTIIAENYEQYKTFKGIAKRCLRFYAPKKNIVSPIEMLAIADESSYLTRIYPYAQKTKKTMDNVTAIYSVLHKKAVVQENNEIRAPWKTMTKRQKHTLTCVAALALVFIMITTICGSLGAVTFGIGTPNSPIKIYNEKQLANAIDGGEKNILLASDIVINGGWSTAAYGGSLNGGNHTITIGKAQDKELITKLSGTIANVKFVISDIEREVGASMAVLFGSNYGAIDNVDITIAAKLSEKSSEENLAVGVLVKDNYGKILNSTLNASVNFVGDGKGNASFGGFAHYNEGIIDNCKVTATSKIVADTVDIAAIAGENKAQGSIINCENNSTLTQTSASEEWSPNVAGIVLTNNGIVDKCTNNGAITSTSTDKKKKIVVFAGGLVCVNNKTIIESKNTGSVAGISKNSQIYVGGIASNCSTTSNIEKCYAKGLITVQPEETKDVYLFGGGISGGSSGIIKDCYSLCSFSGAATASTTQFLGGIVGVGEVEPLSLILISRHINNYYLANDKIDFGVAVHKAVVFNSITNEYGNTIYLDSGSHLDANVVMSLAELKKTGVYWE